MREQANVTYSDTTDSVALPSLRQKLQGAGLTVTVRVP